MAMAMNQNEDRRPNPEPTGDDEMKNLDKYVTTRQAAEMLGVKQRRVQVLLKVGTVMGKQLGHDWLVFTPSLEKYLANKSKRGRPPSGTPKLKIEKKRDGQGKQ
jgi:hypothetical protein